MKNKLMYYSGFLLCLMILSCTKTEDEVEEQQVITSINLVASQNNLVTGNTVTFNVLSNFGSNLTAESTISVNEVPVSGNTYTFNQPGTFTVKAFYNAFVSNVVTINVTDVAVTTQFVNRVLVEEYSGTWCGNCPRILYGTELLKQQTNKAVTVQIHLFGGDPFITSHGNSLASSQGVNGVPTGKINRTINWFGPQYQNVSQVLEEINPSASVGLSINSTVASNMLTINVKMGFTETSINSKLVVYLVEDNLFHTQANYSANLYGGLSSIPNFEYDGVLRAVVSANNGDAISVSGNEVIRDYSLTLPSNISNISNVKIVAFLTEATTGTVLNVREAVVGQSQQLEILN